MCFLHLEFIWVWRNIFCIRSLSECQSEGVIMKSICFSLIFVLLAFAAIAHKTGGDGVGDWALVKTENGIQVYVRKVPGSSFHEFKGIAIVNSKIEVVGEVLRDVPFYPQWLPDCTQATILEKTDKNNMVLYYAQKLPWPADNRDVVLSAKTLLDYKKGIFTITMETAAGNKYPQKTGYTRMAEMKGLYLLEYIDREHTKVSYIVKADPGGSLPSSVVNASSKDIPYNTLLAMKKVATTKRFVDAANKSEDRGKIEEMITKGYLKR